MPEFLEPADKTLYDSEWIGTASADNSIVNTSLDLYELAGLKGEGWSILAVDVHAFSHGAPPTWTVQVYAVNTDEEDINSFDDLKKLEDTRGSIPVKEIRLHDVDFDTIVKTMKSVQIQFRNRNFSKLEIVDRGDHPPQD